MRELGRECRVPARVYLVGGATAVLHGWRDTTADVNVRCVSEVDLGPLLSRLKDQLNINVELASPDQFIPPLPGWAERSPFVTREGSIDFFHYDLYSQALAKIERGFTRDTADVDAMLDQGLIERPRLLELFEAIQADLPCYPALDPKSFERAVRELVG